MKIKTIKLILAGLLIIPIFSFGIILSSNPNVFASQATDGLQQGANKAHNANDTPGKLFGPDSVIKKVVDTLLFLVGAISVLMLIYGGIRYTISGGDEKAITAAKSTILYSVIGLVVAIAAYAIVNWAVSTFAV